MTNDPDIQNQVYQCFLTEVDSLLPLIEQDLLSILEKPSINTIHNLMRNAHTLKGSAASAERETIRTVAHHLEDVFKALYNPDITWDDNLSGLLWDCYECLRESVTVEIAKSSQGYPDDTNTGSLEETEILNRVAIVFAQLQTKLGDFFDREAPLPTSTELGFDVIGSIFAESMQQELQQLAVILATENSEQVAMALSSEAEFFIGISESYDLPGMKELAQTVLTALDRHPDKVIQIGKLALEDFQKARIAVVGGDRSRGGEPSIPLLELAAQNSSADLFDDLDEFFSANQSELLPEPESATEATLEPECAIELIAIEEPNHDTTSSYESTGEDTVQQILQEIGLSEPEFNISKSSDFSARSPEKEQTTNPKSAFFSQLSGKAVRVDLLKLDRLNSIFGELLIAQNQQTLQTEKSREKTQKTLAELQRCQQALNEIQNWSDKYFSTQATQKSVVSSPKSFLGDKFDPLEIDSYNQMHLSIESMKEKMMQLQENVKDIEFSVGQSQLILKKKKKLLTDAQENLLEARMLPFGLLLNRFPPIIKQLVNTHHKLAELEMSGEQILIDKSIAENLFDPLLHLLRNAIAHGIESPELRRQQGKPETGRITIQAYHQGNRTTIEVADDGQGIDWEKIRRVGLEQQLIEPDEAEIASETQLAQLLFQPGFSTTEKITELSGRGVGLDVVHTQIETLQGSVTVRSILGKGTVFSLHLPLILITAEMLICQSNGLAYALLAESIERVLQAEPSQISTQSIIQGHPPQKFLLWGEGKERQQVPIKTLASLLNYSFSTDTVSTSIPNRHQKVASLLMLRQQDQLLCLEVEKIVIKQELAIKSLGKKPTLPSYIQGYSFLSDGRLVMAIDPLELVNQTWSTFSASGFSRSLPKNMETYSSPLRLSAEIEQPSLSTRINSGDRLFSPSSNPKSSLTLQGHSILIVDDSPTQRKLLNLMLEKAGCHVMQAENGRDALTQLGQHPEIKLIICDIEMPTVNGFEFLYAYGQDTNLSPVDVIILTSRSGIKHREMAFELGAKAYFTKPYYEQELLNLISDLIAQQTASF